MKTEVYIDTLQSNRRILLRNGCKITVDKKRFSLDVREDTICIHQLDGGINIYLDFDDLKNALKKLED